MKASLRIFFWLLIIGSLADGALAAHAGYLVTVQGEPSSLPVDTHLRDFVPALYWVKTIAAMVMPDTIVRWLFALPSLVYFPARIVFSLALGLVVLFISRRLTSSVSRSPGTTD